MSRERPTRSIARWVDNTGAEQGRLGEPDVSYPTNLDLSRDGRFVVFSRLIGGNADLWTIDLERGTTSRLTSDAGSETYPSFYIAPGGRLIAASVTPRPGGGITVGTAVALFTRRDLAVRVVGGAFRQQYVVARDGRRFLFNIEVDEPVTTPVTIIRHWSPRLIPDP